ncbi:MAG: FliG C-terminal domain-containing protein [Pseudobdellovibrionaceae bacterium]
MIVRYQKAGGFVSLVRLIESCGPKKQQQLLSAIEQEDPKWAQAVRLKMLSVDRVFKWTDESLAEIVDKMNELTLAVALHGPLKDHFDRALTLLPKLNKRRILQLKDSKNPTAEEIATATLKILEIARECIASGRLKLDRIDPQLMIEEGIEEKISTGLFYVSGGSLTDNYPPPPPSSTAAGVNAGPNDSIRSENMVLREENRMLKEKLLKVQTWLAQSPI